MKGFKDFLAEAEEKEKVKKEEAEEDTGKEKEEEAEEVELDEFQKELVDRLTKKYPDADEEDIMDMVKSVSAKIYKKFEPKED